MQTGIVLQVGANPTLNVTLQLGQLEETVTVQGTARARRDAKSRASARSSRTSRSLELPLNGRQLTELIFQAGLATGGKGTADAPGAQRAEHRRAQLSEHDDRPWPAACRTA